MSHKNKAIDIIPPKHIWVGEKSAPVSLVEFGDYESEACAKLQPVIAQLLEAFSGKLKFQFRHFPLTQVHQRAHKAAEASVAASQHGRFWEMHDLLFRHRRNLGSISLREYAIEAGVKDKNFIAHLIFINGERFTGVPNLTQLSKAVQAALNQEKARRA